MESLCYIPSQLTYIQLPKQKSLNASVTTVMLLKASVCNEITSPFYGIKRVGKINT